MKYFIVKNGNAHFGRIKQPTIKKHDAYIARWKEMYPEDSPETIDKFITKAENVFLSFIEKEENVEGIECITNYSIKNPFESPDDVFSNKKQNLQVNSNLRSYAKKGTKKIHLEKIEPPKHGPIIEEVVDHLNLQLSSNTIQKNGFLRVVGNNLTIAAKKGNSTKQGIFLINSQKVAHLCSPIVTNTRKRLVAKVPSTLQPGSYSIEIRTYQYDKYIGNTLYRSYGNNEIEIIDPD